MGTFGDSWALTKTAFRTIKEDKALLLFPMVSGLAAIGIIILFGLGFFSITFYSGLTGNAYDAVMGILFIVMYFLLWVISIYFTGALVGAAMMKLNGGQPSFKDGLDAARRNAGKLIAWALITGTIMLLIRLLTNLISRRGGNLLATIFALGAGISWGILTYFVVPVLMFEQNTAWQSLKRSGSLFANTFGKTFISNLALGLILALGFILGIVVLIAGLYVAFTVSVVLGIVLIIAAIGIIIFMAILSSAAEGVLVTALYRYATTGQIVAGLVAPGYMGARTPTPGVAAYGNPPPPPNFGNPPPPPPPPSPPLPSSGGPNQYQGWGGQQP